MMFSSSLVPLSLQANMSGARYTELQGVKKRLFSLSPIPQYLSCCEFGDIKEMQPTNLAKTFCNNLEKTILIKRKNDHRSYIDSVSSSPDRLIQPTKSIVSTLHVDMSYVSSFGMIFVPYKLLHEIPKAPIFMHVHAQVTISMIELISALIAIDILTGSTLISSEIRHILSDYMIGGLMILVPFTSLLMTTLIYTGVIFEVPNNDEWVGGFIMRRAVMI